MSASLRNRSAAKVQQPRSGRHGVAPPEQEAAAFAPLTVEEILTRLAWSEETSEGVVRHACPPACASLLAEEIVASCDPRRFLDHMVETAQEVRPRLGLVWSDLVILVRNRLDAADAAITRSRIICEGRKRARADVIKAGHGAPTLEDANDIARRSLQGDTQALQSVSRAAARQGKTVADIDAVAMQRQLDVIQQLDALAQGATRRETGVKERLAKLIRAEFEYQLLRDRGRKEAERKRPVPPDAEAPDGDAPDGDRGDGAIVPGSSACTVEVQRGSPELQAAPAPAAGPADASGDREKPTEDERRRTEPSAPVRDGGDDHGG